MDPLNDDELNQLLRRWEAPAAPTTLRIPVRTAPETSDGPSRKRAWSWLWNGRIQIPVPIGALALVVVAAFWMYSGSEPAAPKTPSVGSSVAPPVKPAPAPAEPESVPVIVVKDKPATAALSGFQPVGQLELRIVRGQP
jgi:hypothetical protein